jgi:hypothetical protein
MTNLEEFRNNAIAKGLCQNYTNMWSDDKSKLQLFKLACDANAVEFMAKSYSEGWGLSSEYITDKFKAYINGKYICEYKNDKGNGYNSTILCKYEEEVFNVNTTLLCVLESDVQLKIDGYHICKIYIAGNSHIDIKLGEKSICYVYVYGEEPMITGDKVTLKRFMKGEEYDG